ncbi:MAG: cation:proton antiporter [Candidatus Paracaedibacteraceae bacterium]|nr:cation:proton antiporter [Candidatus Paracaedibacteraceae bacterium]
MHESIGLTQIAIVIAAALAGGLILTRLKQPPILGYIVTGVLLGPSAFKLVANRGPVEVLAELGVLLLLFVVGMELNLRSFKKVWVKATLCTLAQILLTSLITISLSFYFDWTLALSVLIGFVTTLSSTAVVVKMMESMGEMKTETGQLIIGILIAQDLAIAPMILIIQNFGQSWFNAEIFIKFLFSVGLIIAIITYLSRRQRVRIPLAKIVAGEKELTALASLTFCFIAAALAGKAGLSAPYGAFLAGLILGNTHERLVLIETTKPIQSILIMFFFLSIGLLLDVQFIWDYFQEVITLLFIITVGKTLLNVLILHTLKLPWSKAFMVSALIAQLGEFAFLLTTVAVDADVISPYGEKLIISLTVLSLAISPLWLLFARYIKGLADTNTVSVREFLKDYCIQMLDKKGHSRFTLKQRKNDLKDHDSDVVVKNYADKNKQ